MRFLKFFRRKQSTPSFITVVSGLPRSGTSMMMQLLEAGGIDPITDNLRQADCDNSKGYYEHELVKALARGNHRCLNNAEGRSVKVVSSLLKHLPEDRQYKIIFMRRPIDDVLASQEKMLINLGKGADSANDEQLKSLYQKHLNTLSQWLKQRPNVDVLHVDYADVLNKPASNIDTIADFLKIKANKKVMIRCVDPDMCHH